MVQSPAMRLLHIVVLGLAGTLALGACAKSNNATSEASGAPAESAAASSAPAAAEASAEASSAPEANGGSGAGATVYSTNCSSCHQADGKGLAGAFPPLAGNPVVTGDPKDLVHIVKYGLTGKVSVAGHDFNGVMPPWGSQLSDTQVADVVTYIRTSWGNTASAVTAADVTAVTK